MFVGADRQQIVVDLREVFKDVSSGSGPRMVVLSAPSGEGKTRIVQEFYQALAADQPLPHYWPPSLTDDDVDWKSDRKRLAVPRFTPDSEATIPWIYWSISCQRRQDGSYAQALFDDITQFNAHADPLFNRLSASEATGRSVDGANALIGLLGGLGLLIIPPVGVALAGVGVARAIVHNRDIVDRFNRWRELRDQKKEGTWSLDGKSHGRQEYVDDLVRNMEKVSLEMPVVIAVDDIHWGDETLIACLDGILGSSRARVLVIATTWPEEDELPEIQSTVRPFSEWCATVRERPLGRHLDFREVGPMAETDRQVLIQATYQAVTIEGDPNIADDVVAAISERFATPMGIRAFFDLGMVKSLIHHGGLAIGDLNCLPENLSQVMVAYWDELPEELQPVLAVAAISGERFATVPILNAASSLNLQDPHRQLDRARLPFRVIRDVTESIDAFSDLLLHKVAKSRADGEFSIHELKIIYDAIAAYASTLDPLSAPAALASVVWSTHVALAQGHQADLIERSGAAQSAQNLARLSATAFNYSEAINVANLALGWMAGDTNSLKALKIRGEIASWLAESGRVTEAVNAYRLLISESMRVLGPDHLDTLAARTKMSYWLGQSGQTAAALAELQALLEDDLRVLGPDHRATLITRGKLALSKFDSGLLIESLDDTQSVFEDELRVLGPDDPETLRTQNALVYLLGESGEINKAIVASQELLESELRVFGANNRDTLLTRSNQTYWLGQSGQLTDALLAFQALLQDQERVLGPDHRDTLLTRLDIAHNLGKCHRFGEAFDAFTALLQDEFRVLGTDHPLTLRTRSILAHWLAESGRVTEALEALRLVLLDQQRVLGSGHPDTIKSRNDSVRLRVGEAKISGD